MFSGRFCLSIVSFLFHVVNVYSQDFVYRHYDLRDGLPSPTIHFIHQTKNGFLWFGTESGLCRYDGTRFKIFTVKDGLEGNDVFGMLEDSKGRIWLQQYKNTVTYIYNGKVYNRDNDTLLRKIRLTNRLHGMAEDGDNNIVLCDLETIYVILNGSQSVKTIRPADGQAVYSIALYTDDDKKVVVATAHALFKIDNFRLKLIRTLTKPAQPLGPNNIIGHARYIKENYYDSLYLDDTTLHVPVPNQNIIKYTPLSDSVFSINTDDGAYLYNINTRRFVHVLPGIKVTSTFIDNEKNLWIGTLSKGIYKIGSYAVTNKKIGANNSDVFYISSENGKIIVGNNYPQIYEYGPNGFVSRNMPSGNGFYLHKIFYHEKNKGPGYFAAYSMGLMNYTSSKTINRKREVMLKHVSADGDQLLVSSHAGVHITRKEDLAFTDTIWKRRSQCALKTGDSVLVGTSSGVFVLTKNNHGRGYNLIDSLLYSAIVYDIKKSGDGLLWVATAESGLYCLRQGKIIRSFTDTSGLQGNNSRCLFVDNNNVWLGTDKGLVKIVRYGDNFCLQKYSTSDGLPSDVINAIYTDGHTVYLGTPEGLCYFDEREIETTSSMCNLVLTGVRINNKPVDLAVSYTPGRHQQFTIEFSGISFRSEQEMSYRYRFNGTDDSWKNTRLNSLEFPSLPYGKYEIEIVAVNKFGKESQPLIIGIHIKRPFYRTAWFIAIASMLAFSLILVLYSRWINIARKKQMQKIRQELKIMELEQMALRAQMNPHFIFNCLSIIQQLVVENDTANAQKFIGSFSSLVRQTLNNAPELFIPLQEEIKFLNNYLELERIRLEDRFTYSILVPANKNINTLSIPNMVIQPFVENAVRHGIRYKQNGQGLIDVAFELKDASLRCVVTDNGVGRVKTAQMRKDAGIVHVSKGIDITFSRIESLNILTGMDVAIAIEDLYDEMHNPTGTKVIIDFNKTHRYYDTDRNN